MTSVHSILCILRKTEIASMYARVSCSITEFRSTEKLILLSSFHLFWRIAAWRQLKGLKCVDMECTACGPYTPYPHKKLLTNALKGDCLVDCGPHTPYLHKK